MVVFDIGGVLIHVWNTWQEASQAAGVQTKLPQNPPVHLEDLDAFVQYQAGQYPEDRYLQVLGEQLGVSSEEALKAHDGIIAQTLPGMPEIVGELKAAGIQTGILSNTNEPHWKLLQSPEHYPALCTVDFPMASHRVGMAKPNKAIFDHYRKHFGLEGRAIVFFDDNAANVVAAKEIGWDAYRIIPKDGSAKQIREILTRLGLLKA